MISTTVRQNECLTTKSFGNKDLENKKIVAGRKIVEKVLTATNRMALKIGTLGNLMTKKNFKNYVAKKPDYKIFHEYLLCRRKSYTKNSDAKKSYTKESDSKKSSYINKKETVREKN